MRRNEAGGVLAWSLAGEGMRPPQQKLVDAVAKLYHASAVEQAMCFVWNYAATSTRLCWSTAH